MLKLQQALTEKAGIWPARSAARIDPMVALRDN